MKKKTNWKSFNIKMPVELIPIYDFLQNELNFILSNDETRTILNKIDLSQHRGNVWRELRDNLKWRIKDWTLHNKTWHSYILFENIRRELQSKKEAVIIYNELVENNYIIDETLFDNLHKLNLYPTRSQISNIKRADKVPELAYNATFNLDYSISEKQFFRLINNNICKIKINKKDWIDYEIIFPSSIDSRFTGRIAKPRFIKRKRDNQYIGICSYEYKIEESDLEDKILGVDIGKIKLFSSVVMSKDGTFSNEYINTRRSQKIEDKINRLYENKQILFYKIKAYENLKLTDTQKYNTWKTLYSNIRNKITNSKDYQSKLISNEIVQLALQNKCKTIHIENLKWLNSQGGKWNHSQIHSKIIEKASMYGIKVKKVSAYNSSKEHPITKEIGEVKDRIVEFTNEKIDRDLLASINLAIRSTNIKLKKPLPKKVKTKRVKPKSNKKEIKEKVKKLKGNTQIVVFLTNELNSTVQVELGVRPLNEVSVCNSLLGYYQKCQL